MNKLSNQVYHRLVAQAEEARELKLTQLADSVLGAVGPLPREDEEGFTLSYSEMRNDVYQTMWKVAVGVLSYHDYTKADIQRIERAVTDLTDEAIRTVERAISSDDRLGPNEPKVPGENR